MKVFIFTMIAIIGFTTATFAQTEEKVTLRIGQQRSAARGEVRIKFIKVLEDSRCPINARCIWAGNAKIKVRLTDAGGKTRIATMDTTTGQLGAQVDSYSINLTSLTPQPGTRGKPKASRYVATFSVVRIQR